MSTEVAVTLTVNGERVSRRVEARRHLIDFLRLDLGLMGSHTGCEHGICGACTVRVDGTIVRGCLVLAAALDGAEVETIEGLSDTRRDPRPAGGLRRPQRGPVRLLHAGHAAHRRRPPEVEPAADARRDPRAPRRQLLPLHRLSRHRRCRRNSGEGPQREGMSRERDDRSPFRRPAELLHRQVGAAPKHEEAGRGPRPVRRRHRAAAHGARGVRAQPARPRQDRRHRRGRRAGDARRAARLHRQGPRRPLRSLGRHPGAPQGHEIRAPAAPAGRSRDLGRRSRGGRGGGKPRRRRRCGGEGRRRLRAAARRRRHGDGAGPRHARHPPRPRRQPLLPARQRERQGGRGVRRRPQGRRGHLPYRPPHRRHPRAALDPGRLQPRLGQAHRLPLDPGAAHDAGRVRQASAPSRGRRARHLHRRRRQLRHQGARLPGRGGRRRHRQDHGPSREVHRRPAGELRDRHPRPRPPHRGAHGRRCRGTHHRHRHRRPHGHRPLLGLSAHQRGRRQPGGEPGRRPLRLPQLPRQDHRGAAEQDAHLPVPRRRPPHRHCRHGRARRSRRRGRGARSRRVPPPQPDAGRYLSAHLACRHEVRRSLPHRLARQARRHDGLRRPARQSRSGCARRASIAASALPASSS